MIKKPKAPRPLTRGKRVIAFIEKYCRVPEGALVGQPMKLDPFQRKFILDVFDNPNGTRKGYLSIARKNGKTGLIAGILLAFLAGPEAKLNSQIVSGAMSRDQAALVFNLAAKMVQLSPELSQLVRIIPSGKRLIGLARNVEYRALCAEGKTAHGLSPVLAILDEVGQVRGPQSDFVDAILTSQGAHDAPLLLAISTQAPNDADLFSTWIDGAKENKLHTVCHLYAAEPGAGVMDRDAWKAANPALGTFRKLADLEEQANAASKLPSFEMTFRNLCLNQRVELDAPFISRGVWALNSGDPDGAAFYESPVYAGLDLSARTDLTALVLVCLKAGKWHVKPYFWTPQKGLTDRAKRDRTPYDVWHQQGFLRTTPGATVDYAHVARDMQDIFADVDTVGIAFDRWRIEQLKKELDEIGLSLPLENFGQGFRDMSPALEATEALLLNEQILHGGDPVLTACAANARTERDAAGNRKLTKAKTTGRIDGMQALCMAIGLAAKTTGGTVDIDGWLDDMVVA